MDLSFFLISRNVSSFLACKLYITVTVRLRLHKPHLGSLGLLDSITQTTGRNLGVAWSSTASGPGVIDVAFYWPFYCLHPLSFILNAINDNLQLERSKFANWGESLKT
ncbi:hypothetical protein TorRG33x02_341330 [Trema orientale]|uniref:Uncharacterized protein n=1 Tax=Trema orientale TaxID=63057 RepID=A0A2P5AU17_TREOI|nr:hypothetical protein TorRG33x02_341330 [Trema orientale]